MDKQYREQVTPEIKDRILKEIERFKEVFEAIQENVVVTDRCGNIIYANPAVSKHMGFSAEEVLGKNPGDLWGGTMPKEFYEVMWKTVNSKKMWAGEVENKRKDGTTFWGNLQISPFSDETGEVLFFLALQIDITYRMELVNNLKEKGDLLALISKITTDREVKMSELKEEIAALKAQLNKYDVSSSK